jgi:hypothetical protein
LVFGKIEEFEIGQAAEDVLGLLKYDFSFREVVKTEVAKDILGISVDHDDRVVSAERSEKRLATRFGDLWTAKQDVALMVLLQGGFQLCGGDIAEPADSPRLDTGSPSHAMFLLQIGLDVDNRIVEQTRGDDCEGRKATSPPANQHDGPLVVTVSHLRILVAMALSLVDIEPGTAILACSGRVDTGTVAWRRVGCRVAHLLHGRCQSDGYDIGFMALWWVLQWTSM